MNSLQSKIAVASLAGFFLFATLALVPSYASTTKGPITISIVKSPVKIITIDGHTFKTYSISKLQKQVMSSTTGTYTTYIYTTSHYWTCLYSATLPGSDYETQYVSWTVSNGQITNYITPNPSTGWTGLGCGLTFSIAQNFASLQSPFDAHFYTAWNVNLFLAYTIATDYATTDGFSSGTASSSWT